MSYSILIVDDSPVIRHSLRWCIGQDSAWEVCGEAENGEIAIQKVRELAPDVVILDCQMPVMDGLEAARQIAVISPHTLMVMFTMYNTDQIEHDAHSAGISHVLSKVDGGIDRLRALLRNIAVSTSIRTRAG